MDRKTILLVDDDHDLLKLLQFHLNQSGYSVVTFDNGDTCAEQIESVTFDLAILDVMIPGRDGFEVCKVIRTLRPSTPIIMLTCRGDEIDRIVGLELGADDYVTKPFSTRELLARIKTILRRCGEVERAHAEPVPEPSTATKKGILSVDVTHRRATLRGEELLLTATEFDLLAFFIKNPGRPFTRDQLLRNVWGYEFKGYENTVNTHINRLRNKLACGNTENEFIRTVWGVGYRFATDQELSEMR